MTERWMLLFVEEETRSHYSQSRGRVETTQSAMALSLFPKHTHTHERIRVWYQTYPQTFFASHNEGESSRRQEEIGNTQKTRRDRSKHPTGFTFYVNARDNSAFDAVNAGPVRLK
jgi:hypothetical protein